MKTVSIVLPVYNGERYLAESIDSILAQTYQQWELIIIDDCSNDATPEIAKAYAEQDARITYTRNAVNKKLPASLNEGFSRATGDYHTWTSDDNRMREDALELMVDALNSNPCYDLVYCGTQIIDADGVLAPSPKVSTNPSLLYFYNVVQACFLYRAGIYRELNGYDQNLFLVEDYDFWLRARRTHRFLHLEERPYFYRVHGASLTATRQKEIRGNACIILRRELTQPELKFLQRALALLGLMYNTARYLIG